MHAPGVADIFQRQWRTMLKNMKAYSKSKFNSKLLKDECFRRFSKHILMYALRRFSKLFKRWTPYEDRISDLRLATSRPLGERSEPCLAARRPTASDDMKSDEGLLESLIRPQQTFERWTPRTQESPHGLARQSEAKLKQEPQSEANVCRRPTTKMQSQKNLSY